MKAIDIVAEQEHLDNHKTESLNVFDSILNDLCKLIADNQKTDSEQYGMVGACVLDNKGNKVSSTSTKEGDKWRHAERNAMDLYRSKYGKIPESAVIITTLSPCDSDMDDRYSSSCTGIITDAKISRVYCGYLDPTQDNKPSTFTLKVTKNPSIKERCKKFAWTFLGDEHHELKESSILTAKHTRHIFIESQSHDYMAGHCHVMAMALKKLHPDWQIRARIGWGDDGEDDDYLVDHVYIVAPDGAAYDCRGQFENEQALVGPDETNAEETQLVDYSLADIKADIARGELKTVSKQDIAHAAQFAKQITGQNVAESADNTPTIGINVRSDGDIDYASLIVDGKKKYESRKTNSLGPYVGKTVGIIRTGNGPAVAIGQVTIGKPIIADAEKFNRLRKQHLVPQGSKFDIDTDGTKYLYPMIDPVRWDNEKPIKHKGIVSRKIQEQAVTELFDRETAFPLKWEATFCGKAYATARDDDDRLIYISFERADETTAEDEITEIMFSRGGTYDISNSGAAAKVLATVMNAIAIYIQKYKPLYLVFSAKEGSRASLYKAMILRSASRLGYVIVSPDEYNAAIEDYIWQAGGKDRAFVLTNWANHTNTIYEVTIDNVKGAGAVPYNQDIDYFGLRVKMKPSTFLALALPLGHEHDAELEKYISDGGAIGAPFLDIAIPQEWDKGDFSKAAKITGHDGRNRMSIIKKLEGNNPIEVHLLPKGGYRSSDLTPEFIEHLNAGMVVQAGGKILQGPLFSQALTENFADGKHPERKGDSARHGIPKHASLAQLDKIGHGSGRKAQLARWQANMRRGRAKNEDIQEAVTRKINPAMRGLEDRYANYIEYKKLL